jgi:hypothetical protein
MTNKLVAALVAAVKLWKDAAWLLGFGASGIALAVNFFPMATLPALIAGCLLFAASAPLQMQAFLMIEKAIFGTTHAGIWHDRLAAAACAVTILPASFGLLLTPVFLAS